MEVTAKMTSELRTKTGAGMMDCKNALVAAAGDMEKAVDWLRQKGLATAQKKSARVASQGTVHAYIHAGGKIGVLLEVNCETDFAARSDRFQELVHDIAMHIAASAPQYVRRDEVSKDHLEREREVYRAQAKEQGKPDKIIDKIVDGKVEKFFADVCLLEQPFVKDPDKTIEELVKEQIGTIGENISVRRFVRFQLGEGLAKRETDLAAEVAAMVGKA
ncbi:MAG: translation elongation factor Ts [Deltaproteobacteria bacterium]|nr:translation elongation factor Ts [Deltaproteobacteria bacterium]